MSYGVLDKGLSKKNKDFMSKTKEGWKYGL